MSFCSLLHLYKPEVTALSCVWLFVTPWAVAYQALLSIGFSRQEYWSGLPFKLLFKTSCPLSNNQELIFRQRSTFSPYCWPENKATFPPVPTLVSETLTLKQKEVGPEFGNNILKNFKGFWKLLSITFWNHFQRLFHDYLHHISDHRGSCFRCHE